MAAAHPSLWTTIIKEMHSLKVQGVDILAHFRIRVHNGDCTVAEKLVDGLSASFRRSVRGGAESCQLVLLSNLLDPISLSSSDDRWFYDLNGDGEFWVKDIRLMIDDFFLPKDDVPTRWIKGIPIKGNVFVWKMVLDRLPTRSNLSRRNVVLSSSICPICEESLEDRNHIFFSCSLARDITRLICRWWDLRVISFYSYEEWLIFFKSIRLNSSLKDILEGVFYTMWWCLWRFRN
ncbi:RNA-directed DNA polymerase, eukaryota [Tanacetum coccineum]